jgi:hypothetical protein
VPAVARRPRPAGRPANVVKDLEPKEELPKPVPGELGAAVVSPFSLFDVEEYYDESSVKLEQLERMLEVDGQAMSLYRLLTMPIRAGELHVLPTEGGTNEADLIRAQLLNSYQQGGMTSPWSTVIQHIAKFVLSGAEVLEKVYEQRGGHWVYRKLAPRPRKSITIKKDGKGGFDGIKQVLPSGTVDIKKNKCLLFNVGAEFNPLYGRSLLLPAYGHFEMKHKLYYVAHLAYALNAIPIREGSVPPTANPNEKQAFQNALDNVGVNTSIIVPDGYGMTIHETRQVADSMPLIDHHDIEMAKAVLGQIINMGTTTSGGSYALGEHQLEMLLLALQTIREEIANVINAYMVPELIDWNFGTKRYPVVKLLPPATDLKLMAKDLFQHMAGAKQINSSPEFWLRLEKRMAEILGFENEIDYDKLETELIKDIKTRQQAQTGVAQVEVSKKQADTQAKAQQAQQKNAEKAAENPPPVPPAPGQRPVAQPAARRKPSTSKPSAR